MAEHLNKIENGISELTDDQLDTVVGGYGIGDTVTCSLAAIAYCPNCAALLKNFKATITGVRGVLKGETIYWVTYHCCGHKSSLIESDILR